MFSFHCSGWCSERYNCLILFYYHRPKRDKILLKYVFEFMIEKMAEAETQMPKYFVADDGSLK